MAISKNRRFSNVKRAQEDFVPDDPELDELDEFEDDVEARCGKRHAAMKMAAERRKLAQSVEPYRDNFPEDFTDEDIQEFIDHDEYRFASKKEATTETVNANAQKLVDAGMVTITENTPDVIYGEVGSQSEPGVVYECYLAKKAAENSDNVGGWVQDWGCDCKWGEKHDRAVGNDRWGMYMCKHARALAIVAGARMRGEFTDDTNRSVRYLANRRAAMRRSAMRHHRH